MERQSRQLASKGQKHEAQKRNRKEACEKSFISSLFSRKRQLHAGIVYGTQKPRLPYQDNLER